VTTARRILRFNAVSAAGFVVQLTSVALLTRWLALPDVAATGAAVAGAVVHNFLWHRRWTWADRAAEPAGAFAMFLRFAAANGAVSIAGNVLIVAVVAEAAGIDVVAANVVAVAVCGLLNYQIGDRVVFRTATPGASD
jgi:putative flippase GtrA